MPTPSTSRAAFAALLLLLGAPLIAAAQAAPAAAAPAASDSAATPPRRVSPVDFLLFAVSQSAEIRTANGGTVSDASGSLKGFEVFVAPRRGGIGLAGRMFGEADKLTYMNGALLIGSRRFSIDLGYVQRTGFNPQNSLPFDTTYGFGRAGFRSRGNLGNTGFTLGMRVGYYVPIPSDEVPPPKLEGWEGETSLTWSWSRFPLTALLGYRIERFRVYGVEQEVSALSMGVGFAFGRR